MNIQHSTLNNQHTIEGGQTAAMGCSMLNVSCWMFLGFCGQPILQKRDNSFRRDALELKCHLPEL